MTIVLKVAKMWGAVLALLAFLCWPMYFFVIGGFEGHWAFWITVSLLWPAFWLLSLMMAFDMGGIPQPPMPPTYNEPRP